MKRESVPHRDYLVELISPARHVVTMLERARPRALSTGELAASYPYHLAGDLARIKRHHLTPDAGDQEAKVILVGLAIDELGDQIVAENGGYRLAVAFGDLRFRGKPMVPSDIDPYRRYGEPFNILTRGPLIDERPLPFRVREPGDLTELMISLRDIGWQADLGVAIKDERGATIIGNRRLAACALLEAEGHTVDPAPVIKTVPFGKGDAADARRLKWALYSNLSKPFTLSERRRLAEYLYGERKWTMARVAEALDVSLGTVSGDLEGFSAVEKPSRPQGGRPKKGQAPTTVFTPDQVAHIRRRHDEGVGRKRIAVEVGRGETAVRNVLRDYKVEQEIAARAPIAPEERPALTLVPEPEPEPELVYPAPQRPPAGGGRAQVTPIQPEPALCSTWIPPRDRWARCR